MRTSCSILQVSAALIAAKKQFAIARKSGYNKHLDSHYSNLTDVLDAIEPALKEHDLMVIQSNLDTSTEKVMHIETLVLHASGEWLAFQYNMPIEKTGAQAYGSTTSYGRRYALCAALSITQSDDDAEIAKRTASDYTKLIEGAKDLEALRTIHQSAKSSLSAAEWKVTEPKLLTRRAELSVNDARGFQPAEKPTPQQKKKAVEGAPANPVQSTAQNIEDFG